jgi:hypothetical protein
MLMRTALALLSLVWIGGAALAQVGPTTPPAPNAAGDAKGTVSTPAATKNAKKARREKVAATTKPAKATPADALTSCLQLWEPATHMTRSEWARACRRVDERLKGATLR